MTYHIRTFGIFLSSLQTNAKELINFDTKDLKYKIAGLALFDCLLDVNYSDEIYVERRSDISRILLNLLKTIKVSIEAGEKVIRIGTQCVGHLARVATPAELETLTTTFINLALEFAKDQRLETNRFIGVLLMNQFASNAPHIIFQKRHGIIAELWNLICDKCALVRDAAAEALENTLLLIAQRDMMPEHLVQAIKQVETGFSSSRVEKLVGSLMILDIITGGNTVTNAELIEATKKISAAQDGGMYIDDLIWKVLMWKDYTDMDLKQRVMKLIPKLAMAFNEAFTQQNDHSPQGNYFYFTIKHLLDCIKQKKDRSIAYVSMGKLLVAMSSSVRQLSNIDEIFAAICEGFKDPFCNAALECLGMVVGASPSFRSLVTNNLIDSVFHGGLTKDLIATLEIIFTHVPTVRKQIQSRLSNDITFVLQSHSVVLDEDHAAYRAIPTSPTVGLGTDIASRSKARGVSHWGSPSRGIIKAIKGSKPQFFNASPFVAKQEVKGNSSEEVLVLTLDVLASSQFFPRQLDHSILLLRIAYDYVVRYLDDYNPKIRSAAAMTCIAIVDKATTAADADAELYSLVPKLVDALLMIGIGDELADIRHRVFSSLTPSVDPYVARSDCIHCVIDALHDEDPQVRTAAVSVLTRAAHYDPVHIMPIVLLSLRELLNLLQTSDDSHALHFGVLQLESLVKGLGSYIVPYARQVLRPLLDLLSNSSYEVSGAVLSTIGEVAIACPGLIRSEHLDELFPSLIHALKDSSSISKQETAVIALGKLVTSLHMVNEPYTKYPGLFEGLVSAIQQQSQEAAELRQQAVKTAGLLGALEVGLFEKYMRAKTGAAGNVFTHDLIEEEVPDDEVKTKESPEDETLGKLDKYYLSVVMRALMNILRDPAQSIHHQMAINIATRIIRNLGRKCHYQTDEIIDGIFSRLTHVSPSSSLHSSLVDLLITLISSVGTHISKHYSRISQFIRSTFSYNEQAGLFILEALHTSIPVQDLGIIVRDVISLLISTMKQEPLLQEPNEVSSNMVAGVRLSGRHSDEENRKSLPRSGLIIKSLIKIADGLEEYKITLIPVLLGIISDAKVITQRRCEALRALMFLVRDVELNQLVGRIIHPLVRLLESSEIPLLETTLTSLSTLACRLGKSYEPFIVPVRRRTKLLSRQESTRLKQLEEYESIVALIIKDRPLPILPESSSSIVPDFDERKLSVPPVKNANEPLPISMQMLETAWTLNNRAGASYFVEWYRILTFEFIRQSPTSIIRQCTGLAKNYRPLAQELLNASFISLWDSISASDSFDVSVVVDIPLIKSLESALRNSSIPTNITNAILNLAEFMDLQDKMLPLDIPLLAKNAESRSGMLAKCVRYREMEFLSTNVLPTADCVESLMSAYHQLGFQDSAEGLINCVKGKYSEIIAIQANWMEKLNRYDDAKAQYEADNKNWELMFNGESPLLDELWLRRELGILRCLNQMGNFEELEANALRLKRRIKDAEQAEVKASWLSNLKNEEKVAWMSQIQHLGANAAWMLGHWTEMEEVSTTFVI